MPMFRTTWFFKRGNYGWTENLHNNQSTMAAVSAAVDVLAPARKALLANDCILAAVRISDDLVKRDSLFRQETPVFGPGTWPGTSDPAFTSLLVRMDGGATNRRSLYLRGIPDELSEAGQWFDDPVWHTRWDDYKTKTVGTTWALKRLLATANPEIKIFSIDNTGKVNTIGAHGFTDGTRIHFTGVRVTPPFRAIEYVLSTPSLFEFTIQNYGARGVVFGGGNVRKYDFELVSFTKVQWERLVKKSTGRPFDSPVGRRKRRK